MSRDVLVSEQGQRAVTSGLALESMVEGMFHRAGAPVLTQAESLAMGGVPSLPCLLRRVSYTGLFGTQSHSEFLLKGVKPEDDTFIECRWQSVPGSVEQKMAFLYLNAFASMPAPNVILVIAGGGAREAAVEWLRRECMNPTLLAENVVRSKRVSVMTPEELLGYLAHHLPEQGGVESGFAEVLEQAPARRRMPSADFPQANEIGLVTFAVDAAYLNGGVVRTRDVARWLGVSERQGGYYANGAAFLGLLKKAKDQAGAYQLTVLGRKFANADRAGRVHILTGRIAALPIFREIWNHTVETGKLPSLAQVESLMSARGVKLTGKTMPRRAGGARQWVRWARGVTGQAPAL